MERERRQLRADGELQVVDHGDVLEVVFNRPERHNAFTSAVYEGLLELCSSLREDTSVRAVVFRGAGGKAFAAGNEISEFRTNVRDGAEGVAYEATVRRVLRAVAELPQATIAAADGICVGGGLTLAA